MPRAAATHTACSLSLGVVGYARSWRTSEFQPASVCGTAVREKNFAVRRKNGKTDLGPPKRQAVKSGTLIIFPLFSLSRAGLWCFFLRSPKVMHQATRSRNSLPPRRPPQVPPMEHRAADEDGLRRADRARDSSEQFCGGVAGTGERAPNEALADEKQAGPMVAGSSSSLSSSSKSESSSKHSSGRGMRRSFSMKSASRIGAGADVTADEATDGTDEVDEDRLSRHGRLGHDGYAQL